MPSSTAVALIGSAVIGAGSSYMSAQEQAKAAGKSSDATLRAQGMAINARMEMFEKSLEMIKPFRDFGVDGLNFLKDLTENAPVYQSLDIQPSDAFDESYAQALKDTILQMNENSASRGDFFDGRSIKEENDQTRRFGIEKGQRGYTEGLKLALIEDERKKKAEADKYNRGLNRVNIGRGAATQGASLANSTGADMANIYMNSGNRLSAIELEKGRIQGDMFTNMGNQFISTGGTYSKFKQNQDVLDYLKNSSSTRSAGRSAGRGFYAG